MSDLDLDALEAAAASALETAEKATPGPLEVANLTDVFATQGGVNAAGDSAASNDGWQVADCSVGVTFLQDGEESFLSTSEQRANAAFIATSRTAWPDSARAVLALCKEVRRMRDAEGDARAAIDAIWMAVNPKNRLRLTVAIDETRKVIDEWREQVAHRERGKEA
jgi:hypothetical protein